MATLPDEQIPFASGRYKNRDGAALLILDMINTLDFEGADALVEGAVTAARAIVALRAQADAANLPTVYVNDNFGKWHSERSALITKMHESGSPLAGIVDPRDDDYFITKPQFSGFYATNLPVLLPQLGVSRLILTGIATDICVLFTAGDAHMRDYRLWVPENCVAAESELRGRWALDIMANAMEAEIGTTDSVRVEDWISRSAQG